MKALIEADVDVDDRCGLTGYTPVMFAAQNADQELVEFLITQKCRLDLKSISGRTALRIVQESRLSPALAEYIKN